MKRTLSALALVVALPSLALAQVDAAAVETWLRGYDAALREFAFVGVLGGFTTFSTFGLETVTLLRAGAVGLAALNIGTQLIGGLLGVYAGLLAAARLLAMTR